MAEQEKKPANAKRVWTIVGISADVVVTLFLLILSLILLVELPNRDSLRGASGFMGMIYFFMDGNRNGPTWFLCIVVIPLFILLIVNILLTVLFYQKEANREKEENKKAEEAKTKVTLDSLSDEQKKALLEAMLKDVSKKDDSKKE